MIDDDGTGVGWKWGRLVIGDDQELDGERRNVCGTCLRLTKLRVDVGLNSRESSYIHSYITRGRM